MTWLLGLLLLAGCGTVRAVQTAATDVATILDQAADPTPRPTESPAVEMVKAGAALAVDAARMIGAVKAALRKPTATTPPAEPPTSTAPTPEPGRKLAAGLSVIAGVAGFITGVMTRRIWRALRGDRPTRNA